MRELNELFRLDKVPFSAPGAHLCFYEGIEDKKLHISGAYGENIGAGIPHSMTVTFMDGDVELPYTYQFEPTKLTVTTEKGTAEFVFENKLLLRVRVKGISVWFSYEPAAFEGCCLIAKDVLHMEGGFGKFQFTSVIPGTMQQNSRWYFRNAASFPFHVTALPAGEDGVGELALYSFFSNNRVQRKYMPFDLAHANTAEKFRQFCMDLPETGCCGVAELAKYILWMSEMGPDRGLKKAVFYAPKLQLLRTYMWQQPLIAMAFKNSAKTAWEYITNIFAYQAENGALPDSINDDNQAEWVSSRMPVVGFAVCWILENLDTEELKYMDYDAMYAGLTRYADWWMKYRDFGAKGAPCYATCRDCGYYDSSLFNKTGLPARTPDLLAYMALLFEACEKLAVITRRPADAERWAAGSKAMIAYLTEKLWNGEKFLVENAVSGELFESASALMFTPVILGKRLPAEILDKLAAKLMDPETYLTDLGVASECQKSPCFSVSAIASGRVVAPVEMILCQGLKAAGKEAEAKTIAERYLAAAAKLGFGLALDPTGTAEPDYGMFSPDQYFYSISAAAYLFLLAEF